MSAKVFERESDFGNRIVLAELLAALAGRVRENRLVGSCSVIDGTGVFAAVYVPNGEISPEAVRDAMSKISLLIPTCDVRSNPSDKAVTLADEQGLSSAE